MFLYSTTNIRSDVSAPSVGASGDSVSSDLYHALYSDKGAVQSLLYPLPITINFTAGKPDVRKGAFSESVFFFHSRPALRAKTEFVRDVEPAY